MRGTTLGSLAASVACAGLLRRAESSSLRSPKASAQDELMREQTIISKGLITIGPEFRLAYQESLGFFDDIQEESWERMKTRVKETPNNYNSSHPLEFARRPHVWYQLNWQPNFSCPNERMIGGLGDGAKWVCNPHRVKPISEQRVKAGGKKCLIYSVGSNGNFLFEEGIEGFVGVDTCEIHIFDIDDYAAETPDGMFFHSWGIKGDDGNTRFGFKTLKETVKLLGHEGRILDIFKIDCEGCEWFTYQDWFNAGVDIRQILVETHVVPDNSNHFFQAIKDEGFVTFHKEANTLGTRGRAQEYAFLKVDKAFFE